MTHLPRPEHPSERASGVQSHEQALLWASMVWIHRRVDITGLPPNYGMVSLANVLPRLTTFPLVTSIETA